MIVFFSCYQLVQILPVIFGKLYLFQVSFRFSVSQLPCLLFVIILDFTRILSFVFQRLFWQFRCNRNYRSSYIFWKPGSVLLAYHFVIWEFIIFRTASRFFIIKVLTKNFKPIKFLFLLFELILVTYFHLIHFFTHFVFLFYLIKHFNPHCI